MLRLGSVQTILNTLTIRIMVIKLQNSKYYPSKQVSRFIVTIQMSFESMIFLTPTLIWPGDIIIRENKHRLWFMSHVLVNYKTIYIWMCSLSVVNQFYKAEILTEYVIRGNTAVLKCSIPSFVADFVYVEAWIDDSGSTLTASDKYGKLIMEIVFFNSCVAVLCNWGRKRIRNTW